MLYFRNFFFGVIKKINGYFFSGHWWPLFPATCDQKLPTVADNWAALGKEAFNRSRTFCRWRGEVLLFFLKKIRIRIFCKERFLFSVTWLEKDWAVLNPIFSCEKNRFLRKRSHLYAETTTSFFFHRLWFPLENKFAGRRNYVFWFNEILKDMWNACYNTQPNRQKTKGNTHIQKERHEKIKTECQTICMPSLCSARKGVVPKGRQALKTFKSKNSGQSDGPLTSIWQLVAWSRPINLRFVWKPAGHSSAHEFFPSWTKIVKV